MSLPGREERDETGRLGETALRARRRSDAAASAIAAPIAHAAASAPTAPAMPVRRPMTVGDLGAVMSLEAQAYSHPWSHGNFVDSLAAGHLAEVLVGDALVGYFVAMVGFEELHLLNLTVAPARQGQGHGSAMLEVVLAHARARGLPTVWLEVRASNARARALYARRGFAEAGLRRGYYPAARGREDAVVMRRDVERASSVAHTGDRPDTLAPADQTGGPDALD